MSFPVQIRIQKYRPFIIRENGTSIEKKQGEAIKLLIEEVQNLEEKNWALEAENIKLKHERFGINIGIGESKR